MRIRASRVAAYSMTVALATSVIAAAIPSAVASMAASDAATTPNGLQGDINGDGYRDVVTAAPTATVDGKKGAGQVAVAYGSASGLKARKSALSQNSPGVPGTAEKEDRFGTTVHTGDFDGDGYADVAVGVGGEDVTSGSTGTDKNRGVVQILWGSASGLAGGTTMPDPAPSGHDKFGRSLAAGDFDGDGTTDLAVGSTSAQVHVFKGGITRAGGDRGRFAVTAPIWEEGAGAFTLTSGDVDGDAATDLVVNGLDDTTDDNVNVLFKGSSSGPTSPTKLSGGLASAIADFDGDGYGDIAIGNHWEPGQSGIPGSVVGGKITIHYGAGDGVDATRPAQHIDQKTRGVPGSPTPEDGFGKRLSAGDIDKDGHADLAVGVPQKWWGVKWQAGAVVVLKGTASGLSGAGATRFHQDSAGIPGKIEEEDRFGSAVLLSDVTKDGHADLTIGGAGENEGRGALWNLRGSASGMTTSGAVNLTPGAFGAATSPNTQLGRELTG